MRIAVPREIKNNEYRVGLTPSSVHELCAHGHEVRVQAGFNVVEGRVTHAAVAQDLGYTWADPLHMLN